MKGLSELHRSLPLQDFYCLLVRSRAMFLGTLFVLLQTTSPFCHVHKMQTGNQSADT